LSRTTSTGALRPVIWRRSSTGPYGLAEEPPPVPRLVVVVDVPLVDSPEEQPAKAGTITDARAEAKRKDERIERGSLLPRRRGVAENSPVSGRSA
jgi:hypothetical protein